MDLLLYVVAIDLFLRRIDCGPLAGGSRDQAALEAILSVIAYDNDITIFVSPKGKAKWVLSEVLEAPRSKVNWDKCQSLAGRGRSWFPSPGQPSRAQECAKVFSIEFGQGYYPNQNWDSRLKSSSEGGPVGKAHPVIAIFHGLPKTHKGGFPPILCPVISGIKSLGEGLSSLVNSHLQILVKHTSGDL